MKLCTFYANEETHVGVKTDGGIVDITSLGFPSGMNEIISGGAAMVRKIVKTIIGAPVIDETTLRFSNITNPAKIICVGLNYVDHALETGGTAPEFPVFFSKFNDCLFPAGEPVNLPDWQSNYDYEAELVIVVGKQAYNIPADEAYDCIYGFACGNDLSARDSQFLSSQWISGKNFPGFGPAGPYIVTSDELDPDKRPLSIKCLRNGETVQSSSTGEMIFSCRQLISWASRFFALSPGDLVFTGTPAGVIQGKVKDERNWLKPGETVVVEIEGIGGLKTPLVAAPAV